MSNEVTIYSMNEAIAEFMELEKEEEMYYTTGYRNIYLINGYWYPIRKLKYHTSWDWLMPVVEKIEKYHAHVRIQAGICAITHRFMVLKRISSEQGIEMQDIMPISEHNEYDFIGNVFHTVYDFITWFNQKPSIEIIPELQYRGPSSHCKACEDEAAGIKRPAVKHTCKKRRSQ